MNLLNSFKNGIFASKTDLENLLSANTASILIISDTHGDISAVEKVLYTHGEEKDVLMFAGDGIEDFLQFIILAKSDTDLKKFIPPVFCLVKGNSDLSNKYDINVLEDNGIYKQERFKFPDYISLSVCKRQIILTHGDHFDVDLNLISFMNFVKQNNAKIGIYGHSHFPEIHELNGVFLINPGSLSKPRRNSQKSCAVLTITQNEKPAVKFLNCEF